MFKESECIHLVEHVDYENIER